MAIINMIMSKIINLPLACFFEITLIFLLGLMYNHAKIARRFIPAANTKNELAVPVEPAKKGMVICAIKNGKIIALKAEPMFPTIFIVAETVPDLSPPMSIHNDQLGEMVISTPNTATEKSKTNEIGDNSSALVMDKSPRPDNEKPKIAGSFLERVGSPF